MNIDFSSYEVIVRRENERHTYGYINSIEIKKFCDYFNDIREKLCTQIYIYSLHELKSDKNLINCLHNFLRMKNIVCTHLTIREYTISDIEILLGILDERYNDHYVQLTLKLYINTFDTDVSLRKKNF